MNYNNCMVEFEKSEEKMSSEVEYVGRKVGVTNAVSRFMLVDEDGNKIAFNLFTVPSSKGDEFKGYLVGLGNIEPYNATQEGFGKNLSGAEFERAMAERDKAFKKLEATARKYFAEHPDKAPKGKNANSPTEIVCAYSEEIIKEALAERALQGEATSMEIAYLRQMEYLTQNGHLLSFEQIIGETGFDDAEKSAQELQNDPNNEITKNNRRNFQKTADAGEDGLRKRLRRDQNNMQASVRRTADGGKVMTVTYGDDADKNLSIDEVNAIIRHKVREMAKNNGK